MRLYKSSKINIRDKQLDIVVCAEVLSDAYVAMKQFFAKECSQHFDKSDSENIRQEVCDMDLSQVIMSEINDFDDIPDGWEECIPWGNDDYVNDRECSILLQNMKSEGILKKNFIGRTIKNINVDYDSCSITLDNGDSISFEMAKYTEFLSNGSKLDIDE